MVAGSFMVDRGVLAGEPVGVFSTPWSGLCSGLKATLEKPVGLTRILLSVFLNSVPKERQGYLFSLFSWVSCLSLPGMQGSWLAFPRPRNAEDT